MSLFTPVCVIHLFDILSKVFWEHKRLLYIHLEFLLPPPPIFFYAASYVFLYLLATCVHEFLHTYLYTYLFLVFLEKIWFLLKINPRPLFCCSQSDKGSRTAFALPLLVPSILLPVAVYSLKGVFEILSNSFLCSIAFFAALWNE